MYFSLGRTADSRMAFELYVGGTPILFWSGYEYVSLTLFGMSNSPVVFVLSIIYNILPEYRVLCWLVGTCAEARLTTFM